MVTATSFPVLRMYALYTFLNGTISTIIRLCVVAVLIGIRECQNTEPARCVASTQPAIVSLRAETTSKPFPREELQKLMKDTTVSKDITVSRRRPRCFRISQASSAGTPSGSGPFWTLTCPTRTKWYRIPRVIWDSQARKVCWVLPPWAGTRCYYIECRTTYCQNVLPVRGAATTGQVGPPGPRPRCFRSNWRSYEYYILCPNPWRLYRRSFRLPTSCSCETC